ncbi:MAG TPA: pitrilysin family protein, partial [Chitinophagaceae bacterium]|nr:pitrilysin family protein [Chitinophagaceae bacterium]
MKKIIITAFGFLLLLNLHAQKKIDRSKQPEAGPAPVISVGTPVTYRLNNGITVLVVEDHHLPKVTATYSIDQGPITEGAKAGEFDMMGNMLSEGTSSKTKAQFDEAVEQMGADVNLSGNTSSTSALTRYFNKAFMLMAEALRHPAFPQESFEKIKSQTLTGLKANEKNAKAISARVVNALAFGTSHPNGEFETEESVNALSLDDIKNIYKQYVTPSRGYLTFVGDIKPSEAKTLAEKAFGDWKGAGLILPKLNLVNNPTKTEVDLIDVPNAVQSEITVVNLVDIPMSSPDYFPLLLANQILGGGSEGHLFMNLREKHGYTYGAFSGIGAGRFQTKFNASASVRNEKADSAIMEILKEVDTMRLQRVSAQELKNAKALYNGSFALGLEDP